MTTLTSSLEDLALFQNQLEQFDLVITGKRMFQIRSYLPRVLYTDYNPLISEEQAYVEGLKGFIMKPFHHEGNRRTHQEGVRR